MTMFDGKYQNLHTQNHTQFCASSLHFRAINILNFDLAKIGQGHGVQLLQCCNIVAMLFFDLKYQSTKVGITAVSTVKVWLDFPDSFHDMLNLWRFVLALTVSQILTFKMFDLQK